MKIGPSQEGPFFCLSHHYLASGFDDSLDTAIFVVGVANELIVQSGRRVGGYGYSLKREGQKAIDVANRLQADAKAQEVLVDTAMIALEDCLYAE